jgi:hypothetical protein
MFGVWFCGVLYLSLCWGGFVLSNSRWFSHYLVGDCGCTYVLFLLVEVKGEILLERRCAMADQRLDEIIKSSGNIPVQKIFDDYVKEQSLQGQIFQAWKDFLKLEVVLGIGEPIVVSNKQRSKS